MVSAYLIVFFHRLAPGVLQNELTSAFDLTATSFGTLASMYFYAYMVMQIPVGMLADTLGARLTVTTGMLFTAAGSLMFGMAVSPATVFAGRFLVGIGVSTVFISILKIQSRWFMENEFATMSGLTLLVGNSGGILAQTPLAFLVTIISWRHVFMGVGFISLVIASLCYILIRNNPADLGYEEINEFIPQKTGKKISLKKALWSVVSEWRIWPAMFFYVFINGSWLAFIGAWGVPYVVNVYGLSRGDAAGFIIWAMLGMIIGCFFSGWISDKTGRRKIPMMVLAILYTSTWGFISLWNGGMPPLIILKPLFFLMGFGFTAFLLSLSVVKETNKPEYTGIATSVYNTAGFLGVPLVATLTGYIIDLATANGLPPVTQFHYAFMAVFLFLCAGTLMLIPVPETHCHNIHKK